MKKSISIREIVKELNYEIINAGNLDLKVEFVSLYQIGYELVGFLEKDSDELNKYINICSSKASEFIETFDKKKREEIIFNYMQLDFPALIFANDSTITGEFLEYAKKFNKNIFRSKDDTTVTTRKLKFFLLRVLAQEEIYPNYSLLEIHGIGVLMTGYEDAIKGVSIELIERGHRLITDKNVLIRRMGENDLEGYNTKKLNNDDHFLLENIAGRNIDITNHFGVKSTRRKKIINFLVVLEKWDEKKFYDRLGIDQEYEIFVGEKLPKITVPVRKGRNLSVIIETAALNYRLKKLGLDSPQYFLKKSQEIISEKKEGKYMNRGKRISVLKLKNEFGLEILSGEDKIQDTFLESSNVYRPSLALSGYLEILNESSTIGIQVFSKIEFSFLESLSEEERIKNLEKYLTYKFPMLLLTNDVKAPQYFLDLVKKNGHILAVAPYKKSSQIIASFNTYLAPYFSETMTMHGVFVELFGFGVLLIGKSGIGKSETALELIHRGHRLVSDDIVRIYKDVEDDIIGKAGELPYFMEIRGLGIIDIKTLYGLSAVRISKKVDMIIEMKAAEATDYMSAPVTCELHQEILGVPIKKRLLEITSGRNAAAMIEIMVMDHMANVLGQAKKK